MKPEDFAQELELIEWEERQQSAILPKPVLPSAKWCAGAGCGQRIPEARREAVPGARRYRACSCV